jgi:branched-chain amino acid transport system permease protein
MNAITDFFLAYQSLADLVILGCGLAFSQYVVLRAGVFSIATPGFTLLGAYTAGLLLTKHDMPALLGLAAALAMGAVAGLLLSLPLARLRGVYQAIATLAFVQIALSFALNAEDLTGGALGLNGIPKVVGTASLLVFLVATTYLLVAVGGSGIGRAFDAIRQDETVAVSLGINVVRYQRLAFMLSGAIAGVTGGLMAFHNYALVPEEFGFGMLVAALAFVVLGGRISVAGPIVGTVILTLLPEVARPMADYRMLVHGALLIVVIAYLQNGIVDTLVPWWRTRHARSRPSTGPAAP